MVVYRDGEGRRCGSGQRWGRGGGVVACRDGEEELW